MTDTPTPRDTLVQTGDTAPDFTGPTTPAVRPLITQGAPTDDDERARIIAALERNKWNRTRAAEDLGMPRRTFYRRLKKLDIIQPK